MYPEEKIAALVGCPREDLMAFRDGRTETKGRLVLWTPGGVRELLSLLEIPMEKTPGGWEEALMAEVAAVPELVELEVYRTTNNAGIILCHAEGAVVRCRIRPGTAAEFRPRMKLTALRETGDLYRLVKKHHCPGWRGV
jgi:hypothetical protein